MVVLVRPTAAAVISPFYSFNQSPVVQIYGLPAIGRAEVLAPNHRRVELNEIIANNFTGMPLGNEMLMFDGESYRTTLMFAHGVTHDAELGIELPYVAIRGGYLDGFVDSFHELFGFSDGGRNEVPHNRLQYFYSRNGTTLLDLTEPASGVGDIRLTGAWQWQPAQPANHHAVALRGLLKLPTGDPDTLLGSGGTDVAIWASVACNPAVCTDGLQWYGGLGGLYVGNGDVLPDMQRHLVGFASGGLGWSVLADLILKAQLDAHTPFYRDSEFGQLAGSAAQLLLGFTWKFGAGRALDFAISEDIIPNNSPDVTILVGLRAMF